MEDMVKGIDKKFWRNRNILITGYAGFLGSHLVKELLKYDARLIGLDIKAAGKDTALSSGDISKIVAVKGDVTDLKLLKDLITKYKIKTVFHLAAEAIVANSLRYPLTTFSTNIEGAWKILEACRLTGSVEEIVIASSDKAYGSSKKLPYTECMPLAGNHPYDVSKSCSDLIANAYHHTYGVPIAITRCCNVYGEGDLNLSRIVPDAVLCAISGKVLNIRSDGKFTRDYLYVKDVICGYLLLAQKISKLKTDQRAFNFSSDPHITVMDLVDKIYGLAGKRPAYKILNSAKYEIKHQYLSSSKARKLLGWAPEYSLDKGLKRTISWYIEHFTAKKPAHSKH